MCTVFTCPRSPDQTRKYVCVSRLYESCFKVSGRTLELRRSHVIVLKFYDDNGVKGNLLIKESLFFVELLYLLQIPFVFIYQKIIEEDAYKWIDFD